ncbi:hypothetical protein F8154_04620 [Alkaliphilus pronyensis]|uniref:N-terminal domain of peptidoglycan hydrolase CwlO-containing protein n=1 Tax=Alkaliphilus pronyensis TaxID=1482732 RepID=A0A6I0F239_9FIRM|nr:hypothetical protein [Alkaliphilus pronyensis]KAB3536047.1 hypothetical protein F8154_04620 [Alkaliphilus pronyensis]
MVKNRKKLAIAFSLIFLITIMVISSAILISEAEPFDNVEEKLSGISEEEIKILHDLFFLTEVIKRAEEQEAETVKEIDALSYQIKDLELKIKAEEVKYISNKRALEEVLKSYQRRGAASYIEIILSSDSLAALLRRINVLRDLTKNTGELMVKLEDSKNRLDIEKKKLTESLNIVKEKQRQLASYLTTQKELMDELEGYLTQLEEEKEYYQERLHNMEIMWDKLKPLFTDTIKEFSRIIEEGSLPLDAVKTTFTLSGIKGSIDDETLNSIFDEYSNLPKMEFEFLPNEVKVNMPNSNLTLMGKFVIHQGNVLRFQVESGEFYGVPLKEVSLEGLFKEDYLEIDLKPLIGKNIIREIEIKEGYIEILARLVLF